MLHDDYLVRLIRRAGELIARALGLLERRQIDAAEREVAEALRRLAKLPLDTITQLDTPTLVSMLHHGDPEAVRTTARALTVLGDIASQRGETNRARQLFVRAMQLYAAVGLGEDERDREAARQLASKSRPAANPE